MTFPFSSTPAASAVRAPRTGTSLRGIAQRIDRLCTPSAISIALGVMVVVGFLLAATAFAVTNAWTSDDVAIQNMIGSVQSGQPLVPVVGGDNFLVKVPLYLALQGLPPGTGALLLTVVLCNVPLVAVLLLAVHRAARGGRGALLTGHLIVAWFLVTRIAPMSSLMIPNGRNGEIGIAVLVLWWWTRPSFARPRAAAAVGVAALSTLFFSDAFFLYVITGAAALTAAIGWLARAPYARRAALIAIGSAGSALVAVVGMKVAAAFGVEVLKNFINVLPAASSLPDYAAATLGAVARNYNADLVGAEPNTAAVPGLLQLGLLCTVVVGSVVLLRRVGALQDLAVTLTVCAVVVNGALYVFTSNAGDTGSFRYMLFGSVLLLLLAIAGWASVPLRRLAVSRPAKALAVVGLSAVVVGTGVNLRAVLDAARGASPDPQARTTAVIEIARARGLQVGLGDYWDGNIVTYMSAGDVRVVPSQCNEQGMAPRAWLVNRPEIERRADRGFVVLNEVRGCTAAVVTEQFGAPVERVRLLGGPDEVWVYDRWPA